MADQARTVTWRCDRAKFIEVISCKNKYEENLGIISSYTWHLEITIDRIPRECKIEIEKAEDETDSSAAKVTKTVNYCNYLWNFTLRRDKDHLITDVYIKLVFGTNVVSHELSYFKGLRSQPIGTCDTTNLADYRIDLVLTFGKSYGVNFFLSENNGSSLEEKSSPAPISHLINLSGDLLSLFKFGRDADVTFKCNSQEFEAHKLILSERSSVFRDMFETQSMEGEFVWVQDGTNKYTILEIDPDVFKLILEYLYSGRVLISSDYIARELIKAADKFNVQTLVDSIYNVLNREDARTFHQPLDAEF